VIAIGAAAVLARASAAQTLDPRIVNGLDTHDFPSVGALLLGTDPAQADLQCSGTLIGCSTFLTAAHCVCPSGACTPSPSGFQVYLAQAGVFAVSSITVRPDFAFPVGDLAVVKLAKPVNGVRPSAIDAVQAAPSGTAGTIVGFGRSTGTTFDYGLKRFGAVTTGACPPFVSPTTSVCWTFDAPLGPPGTDSDTCNGDSGGPLFVDFGSGPLLAGVTSGGLSATCQPTDQSFDANVFTYRSWVQTTGGADVGAAVCGALPPVGDAATTSIDLDGSVSAASPDGRASFDVPAGTTLLRVGMNALDDGVSNFDLYVKQGAQPTPTSFDCARTGSTQFGVCDFQAPAAGTWNVLVHRVAGGGAWQATATEFGASRLSVDVSSTVTTVSPGGSFPFTLAMDNETGGTQGFALLAVLVSPDGAMQTLIPAHGLSLADGATLAPSLAIAVPAGAALGTWSVGAVLWQPDVGIVSHARVEFQIH
jgi:hypothetical protein